MSIKLNRKEKTRKRHYRLRKTLEGTAEKPRLSVHRSGRHIYAQLIVDKSTGSETLVAASTVEKQLRSEVKQPNVDAAKKVGSLIAEKALAKGIQFVVFDRGGFKYHQNGNIAALADSARGAGLKF